MEYIETNPNINIGKPIIKAQELRSKTLLLC